MRLRSDIREALLLFEAKETRFYRFSMSQQPAPDFRGACGPYTPAVFQGSFSDLPAKSGGYHFLFIGNSVSFGSFPAVPMSVS